MRLCGYKLTLTACSMLVIRFLTYLSRFRKYYPLESFSVSTRVRVTAQPYLIHVHIVAGALDWLNDRPGSRFSVIADERHISGADERSEWKDMRCTDRRRRARLTTIYLHGPANVQFTPPKRTRHRQDSFVVSLVAMWISLNAQTPLLYDFLWICYKTCCIQQIWER